MTVEKLRKPHASLPGNPLLAKPFYLTKYIERMGTGTGDMIKRCRAAGLDEPEFALTDGFVVTIRRKPEQAFKAVGGITEQVTEQVRRLLAVLAKGPESSATLMEALRLSQPAEFSLFVFAACNYSQISGDDHPR